MIVEPTTVVSHRGTELIDLCQDLFNAFIFIFRSFDGGIEIVGVSTVVLTVVDFHGACIDVRFQGVKIVG